MSAKSFVDTNVFIYQLEALDPHKSAIAERIISDALTGNACISFQVVQECLNTMLRRAEIPLSIDETRAYLENVLTPLFRVPASVELYRLGLNIQARYRYSFHDALIIAAALSAGCKRLYSEDLHNGQQIEGLTIENPFADG